MYTYKVITVKYKRSGLKSIPLDIESIINTEAAQGWRLSQLVSVISNGFTQGYNIVFEREKVN
jgi:hypothetical protein